MRKERVFTMIKNILKHILIFYFVILIEMILIDFSIRLSVIYKVPFLVVFIITIITVPAKELLYRIEYGQMKKYEVYPSDMTKKEKIIFYVSVCFVSMVLFYIILKQSGIHLFFSLETEEFVEISKSNIILRSLFYNLYMHLICPILYLMKYLDDKYPGQSLYYGVGYALPWLPLFAYALYYIYA